MSRTERFIRALVRLFMADWILVKDEDYRQWKLAQEGKHLHKNPVRAPKEKGGSLPLDICI
jgi:hypothetical protein